MVKYHRLYGFGQVTGIDLPGEASAENLVFDESTMGSFELATSAFGQGFNLTMVQMVAAFSSILNGGHYYQPHVVREITTENGQVVKSFEKVLVRNTLSEETCDWLKEAMHQTVADDGPNTTGTAARVDGYTIGGKTGTAEKVPRGSGKYVVSFIGFAPVENPEELLYMLSLMSLRIIRKTVERRQKWPAIFCGRFFLTFRYFLKTARRPRETAAMPAIISGALPRRQMRTVRPEDSEDTEGGQAGEDSSSTSDLESFVSQWVDEDGDGYDDITGEYYWDDLAEYMEQNGINTE